MILRAAYLIDSSFRIVDDGAVRVDGEYIAEVCRAQDLSGEPARDLGDTLLMPGLVNAHTHLELGFTRGRVAPDNDFARWLTELLAAIRATDDGGQTARQSVLAGLRESLAAGTTLLGDITRDPALTRAVITRETIRPAVVSFGEVIAIGKLRGQADERIAAACNPASSDASGSCGAVLSVGISPHAPYTVEPDVLRACVTRAARDDLPLCIHAAETAEEEQFTCDATGALRDHLVRSGVLDDDVSAAGCGPIQLLDRCGALSARTLIAHANYATTDDIDRIADSGASVAYCPRTHAAFGHPPHPFRAMLARGINVCLGTDSLASNPSLSLLEELRFVFANHRDVDPTTLMRMATTNGAAALGVGGLTGKIAPGMRADLIAIPLTRGASTKPADGNTASNPIARALSGDTQPSFVMVAGRIAVDAEEH